MPSSVDADYDAIHATIVATERGRWFLEQYARRNRVADTQLVLGALDRVERSIRGGDASDPAGALQTALKSILDRIDEARSDLISRHGDPAASGDAALADLRNAVEQIQELVWDMHGRDGGSEFGSQLSLHTKRLTADGDRIERSLGSLRILLGLFDELEQRLRQLGNSPAPAATATPTRPQSTVALLAATDKAAAAAEPASLLVAENSTAWSPPPGGAEAAAAPSGEDQPRPEMERLLSGEQAHTPQSTKTGEFEPYWELPDAASQPAAQPVEVATEPAAASTATDWTSVPNGRAPEADDDSGSAPSDVPPELERKPELRTEEPTVSALESSETREAGLPIESTLSASPPKAEAEQVTGAAVAAPGGADDLAQASAEAVESFADAPEEPTAPEPVAIMPVSEPSRASAAAQSTDEWIEVPAGNIAASDPMLDDDLFGSDDDAGTDRAITGGPAAPAPNSIDWLTADDDTDPQDAADASAEPAEVAALYADTEPVAAQAGALDENADAVPETNEALPAALAYLDAAPADSIQDDGRSDPVSLLDTLTETAEPEQAPPAEAAAAASLYADSFYTEPAPSVRAYADHAYSNQPGGERGSAGSPPAKPAHDWPATLSRETADYPTSDRSSGDTRGSAAYQAQQQQSVASSPAPAAQASVPDTFDDAPQPFAQESPDVPSVLERLESVRSAIAALMDEVNEKPAKRDPKASRG